MPDGMRYHAMECALWRRVTRIVSASPRTAENEQRIAPVAFRFSSTEAAFERRRERTDALGARSDSTFGRGRVTASMVGRAQGRKHDAWSSIPLRGLEDNGSV
jgi:hypothetical protein